MAPPWLQGRRWKGEKPGGLHSGPAALSCSHARCVPCLPPCAVEMPASAAAAKVDPALLAWATAADSTTSATRSLPASNTRVVEVFRLSADFRQATRIVRRPLPAVLPPGHVLIRRLWAGINASDVNYSAGRCACGGG